GKIDVPALLAEEGKVSARGLRAGEDDEAGVARKRLTRLNNDEANAGFGAERVEVIEIGDARQARHGDDRIPLIWNGIFERQDVFGGQGAGSFEMRNDPQTGAARTGFYDGAPGLEQGGVAVELVDQRGLDQRGVLGRNHRKGADQRGDHPAAMNIANENDRDSGGLGETEIGDIAVS